MSSARSPLKRSQTDSRLSMMDQTKRQIFDCLPAAPAADQPVHFVGIERDAAAATAKGFIFFFICRSLDKSRTQGGATVTGPTTANSHKGSTLSGSPGQLLLVGIKRDRHCKTTGLNVLGGISIIGELGACDEAIECENIPNVEIEFSHNSFSGPFAPFSEDVLRHFWQQQQQCLMRSDRNYRNSDEKLPMDESFPNSIKEINKETTAGRSRSVALMKVMLPSHRRSL